MFLSPALGLISVFFVLPVVGGLVLSLTDFDIYSIASPDNARFVALGNYGKILADPIFWKALGNTMYFVLVGGPLSVLTSLVAALLVSSRLTRFQTVFRSVFFIPVVTTLVAVAIVWRYLYHPQYGLLNWMLGGLGIHGIDWLGDPHWAMPAIILLSVWKNFGYNMLILLAGLQAVPEDLYEAARIDGASRWQTFRSVTLPLLRPTLALTTVLCVTGSLLAFEQFYILTKGGPDNSTITIVQLIYSVAFQGQNDLGVAGALSVIVLLALIVINIAQIRAFNRKAED